MEYYAAAFAGGRAEEALLSENGPGDITLLGVLRLVRRQGVWYEAGRGGLSLLDIPGRGRWSPSMDPGLLGIGLRRLTGEPARGVDIRRAGMFTAGRLPDCGIYVDEELASREHLILEYSRDGTGLKMEAPGANGTYVNGEIVSRNRVYLLEDGDTVMIPGLTFVYRRGCIGVPRGQNAVLRAGSDLPARRRREEPEPPPPEEVQEPQRRKGLTGPGGRFRR